jgi:hypothetical protein
MRGAAAAAAAASTAAAASSDSAMLTPPSSSSVEGEAAAAAAAVVAAASVRPPYGGGVLSSAATGVQTPSSATAAAATASSSSSRRVTFHPLVTQIEIEVEAEEDDSVDNIDDDDNNNNDHEDHEDHDVDSGSSNSRSGGEGGSTDWSHSAAKQSPHELAQGAQQPQQPRRQPSSEVYDDSDDDDDDDSDDDDDDDGIGSNSSSNARRRAGSGPGSSDARARRPHDRDADDAPSDNAVGSNGDPGHGRPPPGASGAAPQQRAHGSATGDGGGAARARRPVLGSEVDEDLGLGEVVYPAGMFPRAGKGSSAPQLHHLAPHSLPNGNGSALWNGDTLSPIGGAAAAAARPGAPRAGDEPGVGVDVELAAVMGSPVPSGEAAAQLLHGVAPAAGSAPLFRPSAVAGASASDDVAGASRPSGRVAPSPQLPDWVRALQLTEPSAGRVLALRGAMHPAPGRAVGEGALAMRSLSSSVAHEVSNLFARLGIATRRS